MHISIRIKSKQNESTLEAAKKRIADVAKDEPQWQKHKFYDYYETECDIPERDIQPVFNELIAKHPDLDISATYSEDIREDDMSAQWWRVTEIKTIHSPDGSSRLGISSSTHWF